MADIGSRYTHLSSGSAAFSEMMLNNKFGIVTVMNAKVYDFKDTESLFGASDGFDGTISADIKPICELDTLKVANVAVEGPTKTVTGGQYSNPLIKFGKTARLEMQDALGDAIALEALCGGLNEWDLATDHSALEVTGTESKLPDNAFPTITTIATDPDFGKANLQALHYGADFTGAKTIVGDSFFIDRVSGKQVKVKIIFYQFLPDSLFNLTQDAEGDATVFDMNGDLAMTTVKIHDNKAAVVEHDLFYSVFAA